MDFFIDNGKMKHLTDEKGFCIASDKITKGGKKVGYMYREKGDVDSDSGWRFFAGDEDEAYLNDANNFDIFSLNTICNYDENIIKYLSLPEGVKLKLNKEGEFEEVE